MKFEKLDAIRGAAAMYVMACHWILDSTNNPYLRLMFKFAQEAVIAFFLLSGFVIFLSFKKNPNITFKSYFIKRFRRIYFPAICAYIITAVVVKITEGNLSSFSWTELGGNLLMLQDFEGGKPGNWFNSFMGNGPLWSLSYEWWFYMLFFPFFKWVKDYKSRIYIILALSAVSWVFYLALPNHGALIVSYFIIWWAGLEAASVFMDDKKFTFKNTIHINISLFLMTCVTATAFLFHEPVLSKPGLFPILTFRHFFGAFLLFNIGLLWYNLRLVLFDKILGVFVYVAPISYAIYVIHRPILRVQIFPEAYYILDILVKLVIIFSLAYLIEKILQPKINKLIKA